MRMDRILNGEAAMTEKSPTLGECRVVLGPNPSEFSRVDDVKMRTADLIDDLEKAKGKPDITSKGAERARMYDIAQTKYEEAAMWAEKALTA